MKLELKHLAPYLPYGLKLKTDQYVCKFLSDVQIFSYDKIKCEHYFHPILGTKYTKPILRPLSDLTKEIDHNGEKLSPEKILSHLDLEWLITSDNLIMKTNYEDVLKLLEWHFDIFGLIDAGLAIDINHLQDLK